MDPLKNASTACCALAHGLAVVGDPWSMLILRDVSGGLLRYDQLRASLGIAPNILSGRLRTLVEAGLLAKRRYSERPPRDEYVLTAAGADFVPVLHAIGEWTRRHGGDASLTRLVDAASGCPVEPVIVDRATGVPVAEIDVRFAPPAS